MTRLRRAATGSAVTAVAIGSIGWLVGLELRQGLFLAVVVMAAGAGYTLPQLHDLAEAHRAWRDRRPVPVRDGTRREVRALAGRMAGRRNTVADGAVHRLSRVAEHRLSRHSLSLHDPADAAAAERLLGSRPYLVLSGRRTGRVRYATFVRCVTAIERLDDRQEFPT